MSKDMPSSTLITVVTVVRNDPTGLERTMRSVDVQDTPCFEHLIIDGASTDETLNVARSLSTVRTKILSEPDKGIYDAMNKGVRLARGQVLGFLNAGDCYHDRTSLSFIGASFADPELGIVYGNLRYFDATGRTVRTWRTGPYRAWKVPLGWVPPHPTVYARKSLFDAIGAFDPQFRNAGDYDWLIRAISAKAKLGYIDKYLADMEVGGISNGTTAGIALGFREVQRAWKQQRKPFGTLAAIGKLSSKLIQRLAWD